MIFNRIGIATPWLEAALNQREALFGHRRNSGITARLNKRQGYWEPTRADRIMFVYQSRFLTRGEVWFDDEPDATPVDWIYHRQRPHPLAGCACRSHYTRLIDLQKTPGELLAKMEDKTVRKIIEAQQKDGLRFERCDSKDTRLLDEAEEMWNAFALAQKTPLFERSWLERIMEAGALDVSAARDPAGRLLTCQLTFVTPRRAQQLITVAPYNAAPNVAWRNAVSRANCFLNWENFLAFKEQAIRYFDFSGWYTGRTDIRALAANAFKRSFGGKVAREYDCEQCVTLKGRILLAIARMLKGLRQLRAYAASASGNKDHATQIEQHKISTALR